MKDGHKVRLVSIVKEVEADNIRLGCYGKRRHMFAESIGETFDTPATALKYLASTWGLDNKENFQVFERLLQYSRMENDGGYEPSAAEMEAFKAGKIDLWAADYSVAVEYVQGYEPSAAELVSDFQVDEY